MLDLSGVLVFAAEEAETVNPVIPEVNEMIWALIFFGVLWALMKFVLLPPIMKTMSDRNAKLAAAADASDSASGQLASVQADFDAQLADARAEASAQVEASRVEAEAYRAEVMGSAEAEVAEKRAAATAADSGSRAEAMASLKGDVSGIAVDAASAVMGKQLDPSAQQSVIDSYLDTRN